MEKRLNVSRSEPLGDLRMVHGEDLKGDFGLGRVGMMACGVIRPWRS